MFSDKVLIGLDIGTEAIKMVETKNVKGQVELITYGVAHHNLNLDGYWDATKLRQLSIIIEDLMKTAHFGGVKTVMSVMSKDVYVTTMDFEANWNRGQIQSEIEKQAKYFLPYPPDEMRLSWNIIKNDPRITDYTGKQRVIINALPDFVIENSKNILEHVNLDGIALENQTVSQIRSSLTPDVGNSVLVDIGAHQTTFSIIVNGTLRSSSHIPIGGLKITSDLAQSLGITSNIAEYFKRDLQLINLFQLPKPIADNLAILSSELATFVELNRRISQEPQKIIFTGGGVMLAGLLDFFKKFPVPTYPANCLKNLKIRPEYQPYILPVANQLSTAIGLALRDDV